MKKRVADFFLRRPLFYGAIFFGVTLVSIHSLSPETIHRIPADSVYWLAKENPKNVKVDGRIVSEIKEFEAFYGGSYSTFLIQCQSATFESGRPIPLSGKVKVSAAYSLKNLRLGDRIRVSGRLSLPRPQRNPGGFDARKYWAHQGVWALVSLGKEDRLEFLERPKGFVWDRWIAELRGYLSKQLSFGFDRDQGAFLQALLLGERGDMSEETKDLFAKTGTVHLLAVSGFNVGFVCAVLLFFLAPFRLHTTIKWLLVLAGVWFYCVLVGWQAPLVRATVMATVFIGAKILGRKSDLLNSLGLAAILLLAVNPSDLWDVGFQLSFAAVLGMALFMKVFVQELPAFESRLKNPMELILRYFRELFWVSFVATIATLPITVQNFYQVTPLSLAANLIAVPLSFALFFLGFVFLMTFWWVPKSLAILPWALKGLMAFFVKTLEAVASLPFSVVTVGKLDRPLLLLLTVGLFYFLSEKKIRSAWFRAFIVVLFAAGIFFIQEALRHQDRSFRMTMLDVGQGDAIYFEFPGGGNLLLDAGKGEPQDEGRRTITPFLKSKGVRCLDTVVISHPQADHIGGMKTLLGEFKVGRIMDAKKFYDSGIYDDLKRDIFHREIPYQKIRKGSRILADKEVEIQVLSPDVEQSLEGNINDESLVLKIIYGKNSFLLTGDIQTSAMARLLESGDDLRSDVLKVPHHGARVDEMGREFLNQVWPKVSLISAGENNIFHHPRPETLEALSEISDNQIYRTDQSGAITVTSDGNRLNVEPFIASRLLIEKKS